MSGTGTDFLYEASNICKEAIKADEENKVSAAIDLFESAITKFKLAIKYLKNEEQKQMVSNRLSTYIERLNTLYEIEKEIMNGRPPKNINPRKNRTRTKKKRVTINKYEDEDEDDDEDEDEDEDEDDEDEEEDDDDDDEESINIKNTIRKCIIKNKKTSNKNDEDGDGDGDGDDEEDEDDKKNKRKVIKWKDVVGLENAKDALKDAVIFPQNFPSLFKGNRKATNAVLLYGPPGTGKSFLAQALSSEARCIRLYPSVHRTSCRNGKDNLKSRLKYYFKKQESTTRRSYSLTKSIHSAAKEKTMNQNRREESKQNF